MSATHERLFCNHCGDLLPNYGARLGYCSGCAKKYKSVIAATTPEEDTETGNTSQRAWRPTWAYDTDRITPKDPLLAPLLSAIIPGGGQVYNAHFVKAALIFLTSPLVFPWLIGIADAFFSARRINNEWAAQNLRPASA